MPSNILVHLRAEVEQINPMKLKCGHRGVPCSYVYQNEMQSLFVIYLAVMAVSRQHRHVNTEHTTSQLA